MNASTSTSSSSRATGSCAAARVTTDPEQIRELRGRLSGFNAGGLALAAAGPTVGATAGGFVGAAPIVVNLNATVELDGQKVASVVMRYDQKAKRRNPRQKRGPNRNR